MRLGRNESKRGESVSILLAFDDEDRRVWGCRDDLGETVENLPDSGRIVDPSTVSVGPALEESLRLHSNDLVEQSAMLVSILVDLGASCRRRLMRVFEEIGHRQT